MGAANTCFAWNIFLDCFLLTCCDDFNYAIKRAEMQAVATKSSWWQYNELGTLEQQYISKCNDFVLKIDFMWKTSHTPQLILDVDFQYYELLPILITQYCNCFAISPLTTLKILLSTLSFPAFWTPPTSCPPFPPPPSHSTGSKPCK